jgi:TatA/E family protein of Tat protein translocase
MGELMLILVVSLLVFGPNRLPEIARNLGKAWRVFQQETKRATDVFRDAFDEEEKKAASAAGVIDRPDGADAPPTPVEVPKPLGPPPAPDGVREYEDT